MREHVKRLPDRTGNPIVRHVGGGGSDAAGRGVGGFDGAVLRGVLPADEDVLPVGPCDAVAPVFFLPRPFRVKQATYRTV
jgi:hypothetical protein